MSTVLTNRTYLRASQRKTISNESYLQEMLEKGTNVEQTFQGQEKTKNQQIRI